MKSMDARPAFPVERLAVSGLFLLNGFVMGSWAPKIPELAARLGIGSATLGLLILGFGLGSLLTMPVAGYLVARMGARRPSLWLAIGVALALPALSLVPGVWSAAAVAVMFGGAVGGMDVSMNTNAVAVEARMGRAIMSSAHGFWSLGGLLGAGLGGWAIAALGPLTHALIVMAVCLTLLALVWPVTLDDHSTAKASDDGKPGLAFPLSVTPWAIGLVALLSMIPEGAVLDWGALYLREELGAGTAASGWAFGACSATMAVMRFAGDSVRNRLGAVTTLRLSALAAASGLLIAGSVPWLAGLGLAAGPLLAIAGFAITGLGIANMVPIAFSAAGALPGVPAAIGMAVASTCGYSGILLAPSAIGFIAERTGFAAIYCALPLLLVVVLALSSLARHAQGPTQAAVPAAPL